MRKRAFLLSAGLLAVAGGAALLRPWTQFGRDGVGPVITVQARQGDIEDAVLASGTLEPARLVSVGAQVSGRLVALNVALGERVEAGQLVGEIDSVPQENAVRKAQATLASLQAQRARARAMLRQAQLAHRRQADILSGHAGTQQDYEVAEAAHEGLKADLANLEAQIEGASVDVAVARTNLGYTRITAPIDGTVVAIVTRQGQTVISAQAAPTIVKLADLATMSVKAKVSEADVGRLKPGTPVVLTPLAQPDRRYETSLRTIDPAPDQILAEASAANQASSAGQGANEAIYFNARFEIDNPDGLLRPLMTAQVSFVLARVRGAILVPTAAVRRSGDGRGQVTVLDGEGRPQDRPVRTGLAVGTDIQIVDGVRAGEAVVLAGPGDVPGAGR